MHPEHHHGHHHEQMKESWGCDQQSLGTGFLRTHWEMKCLAGISGECLEERLIEVRLIVSGIPIIGSDMGQDFKLEQRVQ